MTPPAWHRSDIEFAVGQNNEQCSGWLYTPVHKRCAVKTRFGLSVGPAGI
jgi:hypothetical protein